MGEFANKYKKHDLFNSSKWHINVEWINSFVIMLWWGKIDLITHAMFCTFF